MRAATKLKVLSVSDRITNSAVFWSPRVSTLKEISELLGKETIDLYNQSENRGSQVSHGLSYQKLGKELMTQDELAVMDGGKCIFMLRGVRPFLSDKYDLTRHPNYRYTADADHHCQFVLGHQLLS